MVVNRPLCIVDASVILKWLLFEPENQEEALRLRQDYFEDKIELAITDYTYAEILNTLGRKLSQEKALSGFSQLLTYQLQECHITIELASLGCELMKESTGITFYDTGYHALALQQGGTFITADEQYYKKTKKKGHVMLLKQYGRKR